MAGREVKCIAGGMEEGGGVGPSPGHGEGNRWAEKGHDDVAAVMVARAGQQLCDCCRRSGRPSSVLPGHLVRAPVKSWAADGPCQARDDYLLYSRSDRALAAMARKW